MMPFAPPASPQEAQASIMPDPSQSGAQLMRLLQLSSPTLPVGAYSYSQGLEWAAAQGTVHDEASARTWIEDLLRFSIASFELPCLMQMLEAARLDDALALRRLNSMFLASRESAELRAETVQMGRSLVRLFGELQQTHQVRSLLDGMPEPAYPCAWACAAVAFELPQAQCRAAYTWAWIENQVLAAIKLVPLGQSAGQRMLLALTSLGAELCEEPLAAIEDWTSFAPGFGLASIAHETQYTRLFRS
jgi:urease accessory protein